LKARPEADAHANSAEPTNSARPSLTPAAAEAGASTFQVGTNGNSQGVPGTSQAGTNTPSAVPTGAPPPVYTAQEPPLTKTTLFTVKINGSNGTTTETVVKPGGENHNDVAVIQQNVNETHL